MSIRIFILLTLFAILFFLRLYQIGGLDKKYQDPNIESLSSSMENVRKLFSNQSSVLLPQPQASLLSGMVIGDTVSMPRDFNNALKRTSTIHMVVVSGQNLTLLAGFILSLSPFLGRKKTILLSLGTIVIYAILTGLQVPVIRAGLMVFASSLAKLLGREGDSVWILLMVASAMLIYNPNWLLSISFQLSFLATVGVVIVSPQIVKLFSFIPNIIKQDLSVTLSAQALVLPIIAFNFHQISVVGIFSNLFVLWTVPFIMISGLISLLVSLVSLNLSKILVIFPGILLQYFTYIVLLFNTNFASLNIGRTSIITWLGYYLLIGGLFFTIKKVNNAKLEVNEEKTNEY